MRYDTMRFDAIWCDTIRYDTMHERRGSMRCDAFNGMRSIRSGTCQCLPSWSFWSSWSSWSPSFTLSLAPKLFLFMPHAHPYPHHHPHHQILPRNNTILKAARLSVDCKMQLQTRYSHTHTHTINSTQSHPIQFNSIQFHSTYSTRFYTFFSLSSFLSLTRRQPWFDSFLLLYWWISALSLAHWHGPAHHSIHQLLFLKLPPRPFQLIQVI